MREIYNRAEHLAALHRSRRENTIAKTEEAIKRLLKAHKPINFNSVAAESGVSKSTLYNNSCIRERIEFLRKNQAPSPLQLKTEMDKNNKDAVIASLQRKIHALEDKNRKLRERLKFNYSGYYEKL